MLSKQTTDEITRNLTNDMYELSITLSNTTYRELVQSARAYHGLIDTAAQKYLDTNFNDRAYSVSFSLPLISEPPTKGTITRMSNAEFRRKIYSKFRELEIYRSGTFDFVKEQKMCRELDALLLEALPDEQ